MTQNSSESRTVIAVGWVIALGVVITALGLVSGTLRLWYHLGSLLLPGTTWKIVTAIWPPILVLSSIVLPGVHRATLWRALSQGLLLLFVLALGLLLVSDLPSRGFTFYLDSAARLDIALMGAVLVIASLFTYRKVSVLSPALLLALQALVLYLFYDYADGRLLFTDDHPAFLYRLQLLIKHFPAIPFYNLDWNSGYLTTEFFPSGVLNFFVLTAPLLYTVADLTETAKLPAYTALIGLVFIVFTSWCAYLAARVARQTPKAATITGIIVLAPTTGYFEWVLKYGTLGFLLATCLIPVALAANWRLLLSNPKRPWLIGIIAFVAGSGAITWAPMGLAFLPLFVGFLIWGVPKVVSNWTRSQKAIVLVLIACGLALHLPWVLTYVSYRQDRLKQFISGSSMPGTEARSTHDWEHHSHYKDGPIEIRSDDDSGTLTEQLGTALHHLRTRLVRLNPLVWSLFLPGLMLMGRETPRWLFASTIAWLFTVAVIGGLLKPQLELHRLVMVAAFFMAIPAGRAIEAALRLFQETSSFGPFRVSVAKVFTAILAGHLAFTPIVAATSYINRTYEQFVFAPKEFGQLAKAISEFGGFGRTFFLGFILHDFGSVHPAAQNGGHIAPLPQLSGKPLYASHYYHRGWSHADPIPENFRMRGTEGIERFLDLNYVTAAVAFRPEWINYCRKHSHYREVARVGRFHLFTRERPGLSYVLEGKAEVVAGETKVTIVPKTVDVTLKFRYFPQLRLNPEGAGVMTGHPVFVDKFGGHHQEAIEFIELKINEAFLNRKLTISTERPRD